MEDAVRSVYRGERCTYVLNSGTVLFYRLLKRGPNFSGKGDTAEKGTDLFFGLLRPALTPHLKPRAGNSLYFIDESNPSGQLAPVYRFTN